jgi:N-acetyl-anhydromuramyl-L-alanine amidase AmpD
MNLLPHGTKIGTATVIVDIVSKQNPEIRPGIKMIPEGITDHDTGNAGRGADADMHNRYIHNMASYHPKDTSHVSWHISVDEHFIIQHIPFNEPAYHCGDGWGVNSGNRTTIGIEKCMNVDGNRKQTEKNAIALTVFLLKAFKWTPDLVNPHQHWSGKYCPAVILKRDGSFILYRKRIELAFNGKVGIAEVNNYLKRGDTGIEVKHLQENLIKAGLKLSIDSSYGPATENAVKAFQTANGLTADGYYGPATKTKLEAAVEPKPIECGGWEQV